MARPLSLIAYAAFSSRSETTVQALLEQQLTAGAISQAETFQRLAQKAPARPKGSVIWLNAGSLRAIASAIELFRRLKDERPDLSGILTTTLKSPLPHVLPDDLYMAHAPDERLSIVRRFLDHWAPNCLVWVGGAFRPALIEQAQARGVPSISSDAPDGTYALDIPQTIPGLRVATLGMFEHVFVGRAANAALWRRAGLSIDSIEVLGHLEEGGRAPTVNEAELDALSQEIGIRPAWFAAHITVGEIHDVICAHKTALRRAHRLLLIVSTDSSDAASQIEIHCAEIGLNAIMRTSAAQISEAVQVLIVSNASEDGLWYRLAPVSFLGHSLTNSGGCDPYPAAVFGSAIVHGPNVSNHTSSYDRFLAASAARRIKAGTQLGEAITELLAPDTAALMASAAWQVCSEGAEVTDRVAELIHEILDMREGMPS
jgi:3-deoxy-D-manno-octulosonic-acid transferase